MATDGLLDPLSWCWNGSVVVRSTKELQNKPGFRRSPAGLSGQIEFGVIPAQNRCFSRRNADFSALEAGGIEIAAKVR